MRLSTRRLEWDTNNAPCERRAYSNSCQREQCDFGSSYKGEQRTLHARRTDRDRHAHIRAKKIMSRADMLAGSPSASSASAADDGVQLPTSVRGAPAELRRLIRKRQNSEVSSPRNTTTPRRIADKSQSAKRCRQRKKIEDARAADELASQAARLRRLEALVAQLMQRVDATQGALATIVTRNRCPRCAGTGCPACITPPPYSPIPYSPHSVQAATAASTLPAAAARDLASKVDEIAGGAWN